MGSTVLKRRKPHEGNVLFDGVLDLLTDFGGLVVDLGVEAALAQLRCDGQSSAAPLVAREDDEHIGRAEPGRR